MIIPNSTRAAEVNYGFDLLDIRHESFILWIPGTSPATRTPELVLGTLDANDEFHELVHQPLALSSKKPGVWELNASSLSAAVDDDTVCHYWFEILDTSPEQLGMMLVTDPFAYSIDYRFSHVYNDNKQPASVIKYRNGKLYPCDPDGAEPKRPTAPDDADVKALGSNNQMVIYELPTSWVKGTTVDGVEIDAGTFIDVLALFEQSVTGSNFSHINAVSKRAILAELGINSLELLPAADAKFRGEWGYATAHYFAPDWDLGTGSDLSSLASVLQDQHVRLLLDIVMAFGHDPYRYIDFPSFHLRPYAEPNNPDSHQSGNDGGRMREGWGGESWRYIYQTETPIYDPATGDEKHIVPSWAFHQAHLTRWMKDFAVWGYRLDSVNNIGSWDFTKSYRNAAWDLHKSRPAWDAGKFTVIGEELSMPGGMLSSHSLDALWNEPWQERVRGVILGHGARGDNFEWTVRKMVNVLIDSVGFSDGAQAVNYITSHDVEGEGKERLFNFLGNHGVHDIEKRAKLAFVCLLTSVGIPMIFAGEEFCDQHDREIHQHKQADPVNYARLDEDWRGRVFQYVRGLITLRKEAHALGVNDVDFIHFDQSRGGKIVAWVRGGRDGHPPVVVVANFSDENTPGDEYYVPNWPNRDRGDWREVTQNRSIPQDWVGREPLYAWEAKVYTY